MDTSVWMAHLQRGNSELAGLLQRATILDALKNLPQASVASGEEVLGFMGAHALHGLGITGSVL